MSNAWAAAPARIRRLIAEADLAGAAELAQSWRAHHPDNPDACFLDGVCRHLTGHLQQALRAFDEALARAPDHFPASEARAALLHQLGRLDESLDAYRSLAARVPSAATQVNLAVVLEDLGRYEQALMHYESALAIDGTDFRALLNGCGLLLRSARVPQALHAAERLCAAHAGDVEAWVALAHTRLTAHQAELARAATAHAITLAPGHARALALHGLSLAILGEIEPANRQLQAAQAADPRALVNLNDHLRAGAARPDANLIYLIEGYERLRGCDWSDYQQLTARYDAATRAPAGDLPVSEPNGCIKSRRVGPKIPKNIGRNQPFVAVPGSNPRLDPETSKIHRN